MNLQTNISLSSRVNGQIDYDSKILLLGSCFSEHIGDKIGYFKYQYVSNPFGILFHPKAIETVINNSVNKKEYRELDIVFNNEQWCSFDSHSKLNNTSKTKLIQELNTSINILESGIKESSHVIITLGTAWVYRHIKTDTIVANCHKFPNKEFSKELLSINFISNNLKSIITLIRRKNTSATVIFTVSPVRHIKDGFVNNSRSKAHLISAIHEVVDTNDKTYYFPSYEIMMDELRDYRFYKDDMIHPSSMAIEHIWNQFKNVWISEVAYKIMDEVDSIQKGFLHKPFNPESDAHKQFLYQLKERQKKIQSRYSYITF